MPQRLRALEGEFAIARLESDAEVPRWAEHGGMSVIARTPNELSILMESAGVPDEVPAERGWRGFVLPGPIPFSATGVLASVLQPLADACVPILALSTFDTDYVFVQRGDHQRAVEALIAAGHEVVQGA